MKIMLAEIPEDGLEYSGRNYLTNLRDRKGLKMPENKQQESMLDYVMRVGPLAFQRNRRALAEAAGVPFSTVIKVLHGESKNPRADTVQKLSDAIKAKEAAGYEVKPPAKKRSPKKASDVAPVEGDPCTA